MKINSYKCDVAVVGGGPAGLTAALAAARQGAKVILAERNGFLGGNAATGLPLLGFLDKNGNQVIRGIAQEIIDRLVQLGASFGHNRCPMHNSVTIVHPDIFKYVAVEKCREAGVQVLLHCELASVNVTNRQITGLSLIGKGNRIDIETNIVIDATGDGDAAYLAGCSYEKGNPETGLMQPPTLMFSLGGFNEERFFEYLEAHPEDLQPAESMHVAKGYNVSYFKSHPSYVFLGLYSLLNRLRKEGKNPLKRDTLIYINSVNPGQIFINSTRIHHFDGTDIENLTYGEEEGIIQIMKLVDFLKREVPGFENCNISSINPLIGVRETRRFSGIQRLTSESVIAGSVPSDTIALGSYKIDVHSGSDDSTQLIDLETPYGIPLGCLLSNEIEGLLLSGRCISMDSMTLASVRVMPTCMAIGEAAGVCAAFAVKDNKLPSQISPEEVIAQLKKDGAILNA